MNYPECLIFILKKIVKKKGSFFVYFQEIFSATKLLDYKDESLSKH